MELKWKLREFCENQSIQIQYIPKNIMLVKRYIIFSILMRVWVETQQLISDMIIMSLS